MQWSHVGDLKDSLRSLVAWGRKHGVRPDLSRLAVRELGALKRNHPMNYDRDSALIQPYYVLEEINRHTDGEAIISTGVGQHQMWAAQYLDFREPRLWLTSGSMGTMGFGLPAALGAQVAHPDRLVIDIDGDASIRMNIGELETATTYDLPVKVCVLNNIGDGMVRQWQKLFFGGRMASHRQVAAHQGLRARPRRPTASAMPSACRARPTCRAWSRSGWPSRARPSSR